MIWLLPCCSRIDLYRYLASIPTSQDLHQVLLTKKIPMRTVQLNSRKARISHQPRGIHELSDNLLNIPPRHLPGVTPRHARDNPLHQAIADINRDRTGRNSRREHAPLTGDTERLSPRMADLDDCGGAVLLAGGGVFLPGGEESSVVAGVFIV